jgi:hypothetical protein
MRSIRSGIPGKHNELSAKPSDLHPYETNPHPLRVVDTPEGFYHGQCGKRKSSWPLIRGVIRARTHLPCRLIFMWRRFASLRRDARYRRLAEPSQVQVIHPTALSFLPRPSTQFQTAWSRSAGEAGLHAARALAFAFAATRVHGASS